MNYERHALRVIRGLTQAIHKDLNAARCGQGTEPVHRMRVACRRLHNAFTVFQDIQPKDIYSHDKAIRKVLKKLGPVRDLDVQILYFEGRRRGTSSPAQKRALGEYLVYLKRLRKGLQPQLAQTLERLSARQVLQKIEAILAVGLRQVACQPALEKKIQPLIKDVLCYERFVPRGERIKELHQMRIAAKHLRYTLESLSALFARRLDRSIAQILILHHLLGDLHDYHVWHEELTRFAGARKDKETFAPMIRHLQKTTQKTHRNFVKAWAAASRQGLWKDLKDFSSRLP